MKIVTVINAKGGCGKSTIAMNLTAGLARAGHRTLLIDLDPQAQVTEWLHAGDGFTTHGTIVAVFRGLASLPEVVATTTLPNVSVVASADGLEAWGRQMTDDDAYSTILARALEKVPNAAFDFVVLDSPNQISPIMENAIRVSDLFVVPFESTKAVKSYANFFKLLTQFRPHEPHHLLHVLSNLSRQSGLRRRVVAMLEADGIALAQTEIRSCGWLARVDEVGGSIFVTRPRSIGAVDMERLTNEVLETLAANSTEQ